MQFIDEATIRVQAGKGGNGCLSFGAKNTWNVAVLTVAMAVMEATFFCLLMRR